ncbi:hypothetical protein, partial [Thiolapillus sp.]|uniref:hypothetical protein n=1 Tax=Thiolapillus sp. TaxID=2017437 RepID=UPI003AF7E7AD
MTRTAGAPIGCQRPSRFWGLGCPKIYHEAEDTLDVFNPAISLVLNGRYQSFRHDRGDDIPGFSIAGEAGNGSQG